MIRVPLLSATALFAMLSAAVAAPAVGLVGDRTLVLFDTDTLTVTESREVSGVERLLGFDLRPSDGSLIGVTADFAIVRIDIASGAATTIATMDKPLPLDGMPVVVDFNPAADKLRFMTGDTNHRVDVDSGAVTVDGPLAFEAGDMHGGEAPAIVAAAYTNSFGKPEKTAMFDIDATIVGLIRQTVPNDGTLKAVGKLGLADPSGGYAFDIQTDARMTNTAWLVTGTTLHTVDLETGQATEKGLIAGATTAFRDIAILPAM